MKNEGVPVRRAAKLFNVPITTLRDRVAGRIDPENFAQETLFTKDEEKKLVEHIKMRSELGYGLSNCYLQRLAGEMAYDLKKRSKKTPLSNSWLYAFLSRWDSEIKSIKPRQLESTRAKNTTPEIVDTYFENLKHVLQENSLGDKPHRIFNIDETGLQPEHKPPNVIGSVGNKVQQITSPRSTTTTVIGCANAMGVALPPFFIFKGKRWNPDLMKGASVGAAGTMSDSGWVNGDIFRKYLEEHFLPLVSPPSKEDPILLIYDGHASHKNPETIRWAREKGIILFILPAHSSHLLQPLDVAVFGPMKKHYYNECSKYLFNHMGRIITKYEICALASTAYLKAFSPLTIQSGFRKSGIYPFQKNSISREQMVPCESFREKNPIKKLKAINAGPEAVEDYLREKEEKIQQAAAEQYKEPEIKERKKPNPSGRAITEDSYLLALNEYEKNKVSMEKPSKLSKKKKETEKKHKPYASPKPSTSGMQNRLPSQSEDFTESDDDMEIMDDEKCCVCGCFSPPDLKKCQYIKLVSWAQCGACAHWVHLAFCTEERVVRRQSEFLCPHCRQN